MNEELTNAGQNSDLMGRMALVRLQRLHCAIGDTKVSRSSGCLALFMAGFLGFIAVLVVVAVGANLGIREDILASIGIVVAISVTVCTALLFQRYARRQALLRKEKLQQELAVVVEEMQLQLPVWVESVGGPGNLKDGQRFADLAVVLQSKHANEPPKVPVAGTEAGSGWSSRTVYILLYATAVLPPVGLVGALIGLSHAATRAWGKRFLSISFSFQLGWFIFTPPIGILVSLACATFGVVWAHRAKIFSM